MRSSIGFSTLIITVTVAAPLALGACGDDTVPADAGSDTSTDDEVGGTETGTETGTGSETGAETETGAGTETGTGTETGAGTETGTETETETETETGMGEVWTLPACDSPGAPGIGWTVDGGDSVVPTALPHLGPTSYTFGLATLHEPNVMVMHAGGHFYRSEDAGCTWEDLGVVNEAPANGPLDLVVGPDDTVYGYGKNQSGLVRWKDDDIEVLEGPQGSQLYDVAVDPEFRGHIRVGISGGKLQDSINQGESWTKVGDPAPGGLASSYEIDIDPKDLDRAVVGFIQTGWWVTDDGGTTWTQSAVETPGPDQAINGFNVEFAPDGSGVVYAQGIELQLQDSPKRIYRSEDSGFTFAPVVTANNAEDLILTNGARMWVDPADSDRLMFNFGTCLMGIGTYFYRYDHGAGETTITTYPYGGFNAVVSSPADPEFMYIGLEGSGNMNGPSCEF